MESNGYERNKLDDQNSIGYNVLPEHGMVLLQERICSLRGSKFFPVRVPSQIHGKKLRLSLPAYWILHHFILCLKLCLHLQGQSELMLQLSHLGDPRNAFLIYFPISFCLHKPTGEKVLWLACLAEWLNAILKW